MIFQVKLQIGKIGQDENFKLNNIHGRIAVIQIVYERMGELST